MSAAMLLYIRQQPRAVEVAPNRDLTDTVFFEYLHDLTHYFVGIGRSVYLLLSEFGKLSALLGELAVDVRAGGAVEGLEGIIVLIADDEPDAQQLALSLIYIEPTGKFKVCKAQITDPGRPLS